MLFVIRNPTGQKLLYCIDKTVYRHPICLQEVTAVERLPSRLRESSLEMDLQKIPDRNYCDNKRL